MTPLIWKVKYSLQTSTNWANGHYRKWKADKGFHFPNFITALLSSPLPRLYLLPISLVMGVTVGQLSGPESYQHTTSLHLQQLSHHRDYNNTTTKVTAKYVPCYVNKHRIEVAEMIPYLMLHVSIAEASSVQVYSHHIFPMCFHTLLHLCSCNQPLEDYCCMTQLGVTSLWQCWRGRCALTRSNESEIAYLKHWAATFIGPTRSHTHTQRRNGYKSLPVSAPTPCRLISINGGWKPCHYC